MRQSKEGSEQTETTQPRAKRPYEPPRLVDYGSIAHLTQGADPGADDDGVSGMAMIMSM